MVQASMFKLWLMSTTALRASHLMLRVDESTNSAHWPTAELFNLFFEAEPFTAILTAYGTSCDDSCICTRVRTKFRLVEKSVGAFPVVFVLKGRSAGWVE